MNIVLMKTMTYRYFLVFVLSLFMLAACSGADDAKQATWLHGPWYVSHNPKNDDEDELVFRDDGTVVVLTRSGELQGEYAVAGNILRMLITVNQRPVLTEFKISSEKDTLTFENGAKYSRKAQ